MTIQERINRLESFIVANDGQFLGQLTLNKFASESILNPYGLYGSKFGVYSIFNQFSIYGSPYSSLSPYNQFSTTPPSIYLKGVKKGSLTTNPFIYGAVNPYEIENWMRFYCLY